MNRLNWSEQKLGIGKYMRYKKITSLLLLICELFIPLTAEDIHGSQAPRLSWSDDFRASTHSLTWKGLRLEGLGCEVMINGQWIKAKQFNQCKVSISNIPFSYKDKRVEDSFVHNLMLSECPVLDGLEITLKFQTNHDLPYVIVGASITADEEYTLGGMRLLTAKQVIMDGNAEENVLFLEDVRAPNHGRIIRPWMLDKDKYNVKLKGKQGKIEDAVWITALVNDKENQLFGMAALGGEFWPTNFHWQISKHGDLSVNVRSSSVESLEKVIVPAQKTIVIDPVMVGYWDQQRPTQSLLEMGQVMGKSSRKGREMKRPAPGWSSWHSAARNISQESVLKTAKFMRENMYDAGWKMIQIDGGWWTTQGSYVVNEDFPQGMRWLRDEVRKMNLDFGLHISPLRVSPKDSFWKKHADWILKPFGKKAIDPNDDDMVTTIGAVYLDGSHPSVGPYLAGRFTQMVEDYQPTFMKWDHHYGSLEEGERFDKTMTGLQAHNKAIRTIRAALPDDLMITRSMGWLYGAIECYDAIRIGNDINHPGMGYKSEHKQSTNITYGKTSGSIDDVPLGKEFKGLIRFARSMAQNFYIHNNIAICDPDAFFVTEQYSRDESMCHMTLQAIMGGLFFIGDRLEHLPQDRIDIANDPDIMSINQEGKHAIPLDLFSGADVPRVWKLELQGRTIIALFNWLDEPTTTTYSLEDFEMNEADYKVKELWSKKMVPFGSSITLDQAPHSVKVYEFKL
jgi:alpha-galactosidase